MLADQVGKFTGFVIGGPPSRLDLEWLEPVGHSPGFHGRRRLQSPTTDLHSVVYIALAQVRSGQHGETESLATAHHVVVAGQRLAEGGNRDGGMARVEGGQFVV